MSLSGRTMFISGASRGIGLAIAKRVAATPDADLRVDLWVDTVNPPGYTGP